ncbi:MAG: hypothetical protein COU08_02265 [Candidatus Harrisonbacteria bacterium CG10_big_fil_rev_8_21_14_0_10_42_17]|uniref:Type-4 uracil-DNA glycosylase n=1 Tax=Candidatus Harrisonbacteria bacterium CG10_big_fil_rev_8_21_14_0_10_42_17 TaxID=1974584 RepID=A0A2M6WI37_9BACT|nr:MAG: hypothetical protein COU08_02265 [Candidatus Harrisonbacteria bacterium CG10_big_fil_rev_8_21_14_0_10_42_17]
MNKHEQLQELEREMECDESLPLRGSNLVFGEGSPDKSIVFIGEAPGVHENEQRRPFVGRGGHLLNTVLEEFGWQRSDIYITNIVKRRPPQNRDPLPEELEAYKPYLAKQLDIINPRIVVPLGRFAMNYFLPTAKISRDQGKVFHLHNRLIAPVFHPAAALRSTSVLDLFKKSLYNLPRILEQSEHILREAPQIDSNTSLEDLPHQSNLF